MRKREVKRKGRAKMGEAGVVKVCFSCRCFSAGKSKKSKFGR